MMGGDNQPSSGTGTLTTNLSLTSDNINKKPVLLIAVPFPEPGNIISKLRDDFPEYSIVYIVTPYNPAAPSTPTTHAVPPSLWADVVILVTFSALPPSLSSSPNLSLVHLLSAGSNHIHNTPLYKDSTITITTSSGIHGPQIAEWVILTGLAISHHFSQFLELQKRHQWGKVAPGSESDKVRDWVGRRVGILGYGSIGRQVGRVVSAMGAEVIAYTATPKTTPEQRRDNGFIVPGTGDAEGVIPKEWYSGLEKRQLHEFLRQKIDWLLIAVPLTPQTKHFLGKEEFEIMSEGGKRPVFVSNIARGSIVDQDALIDALKEGKLAGAALDVTDPEPLPSDSELWDLKNVIITPHISSRSEAYFDRAFQVLAANLTRRQQGRDLINVVRRSRGY